jgi:hypothetical protein
LAKQIPILNGISRSLIKSINLFTNDERKRARIKEENSCPFKEENSCPFNEENSCPFKEENSCPFKEENS